MYAGAYADTYPLCPGHKIYLYREYMMKVRDHHCFVTSNNV